MSNPLPTPSAVSAAPAASHPGPAAARELSQPARTVIGLGLLLPALVAWLWSYLLPSVSTVTKGFQDYDFLSSESEFIGLDNYQGLAESGFFGDLGFALLLGLLPLAFALLVAPLLAVVADRAGRAARLVTRALLALPLATYAPAAIALMIADRMRQSPDLADDPRGPLVLLFATTSFGLVVAVAATLYLSALRQRPAERRPSAPALLTVGGLLALGTTAAALQTYAVSALVTGGGPDGQTTTPLLHIVRAVAQMLRIGPGAAGASVLLAVLAVLGVVAVGLLLATRTRIEFDGWRDRPRPGSATPTPVDTDTSSGGRPVFVALTAAALIVLLAVFGWAFAPWLGATFGSGVDLPSGFSTSSILANTWLPPLVSAIVSVGLAALAGFGIGALQPLGRWSGLLLLIFAPWLFVGTGPLLAVNFIRARESDQINTFVGLIPPGWLSIPALIAFTLLFRGLRARWRPGAGFGRLVVLPALPLLAVAGLLAWVTSAQNVLWPFLASTDPDRMTAPVIAQLLIQQRFATAEESGGLALILPFALVCCFLVAFVALQVGYLDRLAIRVGRDGVPPARDE